MVPIHSANGLARYIKDRKYGYFDECGKIVIPAQYDFALRFEKGNSRGGLGCTFQPVPRSNECRSYECQRWVELRNPLRQENR
ncbi:WG repeat-containing protein [Ochrobactrum sp. Marseille-Q0166]|nr:WG repeat-containing protein [Ochrobactrum sp. Marseille-Q0166]